MESFFQAWFRQKNNHNNQGLEFRPIFASLLYYFDFIFYHKNTNKFMDQTEIILFFKFFNLGQLSVLTLSVPNIGGKKRKGKANDDVIKKQI